MLIAARAEGRVVVSSEIDGLVTRGTLSMSEEEASTARPAISCSLPCHIDGSLGLEPP